MPIKCFDALSLHGRQHCFCVWITTFINRTYKANALFVNQISNCFFGISHFSKFLCSCRNGLYLCLIFNFLFYYPFARCQPKGKVFKSSRPSQSPPKVSALSCRPCLLLTWWRLHAGGGSTKVRAGYTLEYQHKSVCGHTPPLSQNRSLAAGIFYFIIFFVFPLSY